MELGYGILYDPSKGTPRCPQPHEPDVQTLLLDHFDTPFVPNGRRLRVRIRPRSFVLVHLR